ncbi:hypothetical protein [Burkholderia sp.]|uniref:lipopolysaccharide biosynthesis protein n=1 Tax=Burkholderia sp. TaxID=36773 RepID=UPI00258E98DF|nr:hypothetical protein [Burkholderia sp.]MCA3055308.1 hypothetical protein [Rhodocyclaceae bacterium]MCA3128388.1 hypothetical protein [Rhodocyclaceae bacterium]MCA3137692.1 hypothetical protein [Rhodocyclaceae bacterium]MCA3931028.1 hypothetical protein [Burkholderia sp.]
MTRRKSLSSFLDQPRRLFASLTARNAASSFFALAWLNLLSFLSIPIYIKLLGVAEWGLVAACASLQIVANFVDAGLSQLVPRLVAQEAHRPSRLRECIFLLQRVYVGLGLFIFILLQASAAYLAQDWFQVSNERTGALELAIRIVSFQFLFQFVNSLHTGLWHGLQRQVLANGRACGFGTIKHATALIAMMVGSPQAWVYALAFASVALLEMTVNALTVRQMFRRAGTDHEESGIALRPILKKLATLSSGVLVGLLVIQLDRVILSRTVDVEDFGVYMVVLTLALAFLQLQAPVTRAYFPVLVNDLQTSGRISVIHMRRLFIGTVLSATLPALTTCALAPQVLALWLDNATIVSVGTGPLRLLLLAVAINSIYACIYQVILAKGQAALILKINTSALLAAVLVVVVQQSSSGILLGGFIWLSITLTQLTLGLAWLFSQSKKGNPNLDRK